MEGVIEELRKLREDFNAEQQVTRKLIEEKFSTDTAEKAIINENIAKNEGRIRKLENVNRKRNVIIYGIREDVDESFQDLKNKIFWLFNTKMGLEIKREEIDEFFRLGKKNAERRNRPIIVKMTSSWRKTEIMTNKRKLKGSKIYIENDMSEEEIIEKKNMIAEMKEMKSKGHEAYIKGKLLIVKKKDETAIAGSSSAANEMETEQNNTIYQTPLHTPGKRNLSQRSPEDNKLGQDRRLDKVNLTKKLKIQERRRANSDGQLTLETMMTRMNDKNSVRNNEEITKDNENKNIGYVSIVYDTLDIDPENNKEPNPNITNETASLI